MPAPSPRGSFTRCGLALASIVTCALAGCGVGVGQALTRSTFGPESSSFSATPVAPETSLDLSRVNTVTFYDTTGILVGALGTAGNAYNARMDAMNAAARRGARPGETIAYSYDVVPPAAGTFTSLTLAFGDANSGEYDGVAFSNAEVDYWLFDLRSTFLFFDLTTNMELGVSLGVLWEEWSGNDVDASWIGMPLGASLSYAFHPMMAVTPRLAIDPLMGALTGLLSDGGHWLWIEAGARLDVRPTRWLVLYADVLHRIQPWELGDRDGSTTQLGVGAALMFTSF